MLASFLNSFADRISVKIATKSYLNIPPHLNYVATLPCEISMFKISPCSKIIETNCHVRLSHSKNSFKIFVSQVQCLLSNSVTKDVYIGHIKIPLSTVHSCCIKEKDVAAKWRTLSAIGQLLQIYHGIFQ